MTADEIFYKAQPNINTQPISLAMPRIPTASQTYIPNGNEHIPTPYAPYANSKLPYPKRSNNPDYVVDVLKILPINTKYMSNTTNGFAYNSIADVLLNKEAWKKRWGYETFMTSPLGYIPRVVTDLVLLTKDKAIAPVVDSVRLALADPNDDMGILKGVQTGMNTLALNTLVNFGDTLDVLANPVKGLILDGAQGFVKGTVGTGSEGRKRYDFTNHIDYGTGLAAGTGELLTSIGLEILTDPVNWFTLGTAGVAKTAASATADTATSATKIALRNIANRAATVTDDVVSELVEASGKKLSTKTAKTILKEVSDDSGKVLPEAVENLIRNSDDLSSAVIKNSVRQAEFGKTRSFQQQLKQQLYNLRKSQTARYKAGLFNNVEYTKGVQRMTTDLLDNLDISKLPALRTPLMLNQIGNTAERTLRSLAGLGPGGWTYFTAGKKGINYAGDIVNNFKFKKYTNWIETHPQEFKETLSALFNEFGVDFTKAVDEHGFIKGTTILGKTVENVNEGLNLIYDDNFVSFLISARADTLTQHEFKTAQRRSLTKLNKIIKKSLGKYNINTFEEYISYVKNLSDKSDALTNLNLKLQSMYNTLTANIDDPGVFQKIKNTSHFFKDVVENTVPKFTNSQDDSIQAAASRLKIYRKQNKLYKTIKDTSEPFEDIPDDVLAKAANDVVQNADTLEKLPTYLNQLDTYKRADTTEAIEGMPPSSVEAQRIIEDNYSLNEHYIDFKETYASAINRFKTAKRVYDETLVSGVEDDVIDALKELRKAQYDLVKEYDEFVTEHLEPLVKFNGNINASNASELRNAIGETALRTAQRESHIAEIVDNVDLIKTQDYSNLYKLFGDYLNETKDSTTSIADVFDELYLRLQQLDEAIDNFNNEAIDNLDDIVVDEEIIAAAQKELDELYAFYENNIFESASNAVKADGVSFIRTLFGIEEDIDTAVVKPHKVFNDTKVTVTAEDVGDMIRSLKTHPDVVKVKPGTVDVSDYYKGELTSYLIGSSQTQFALGLINGFSENDLTTTGLAKVLNQYQNTNSSLYKILNHDTFKNDIMFKDANATLQRLSHFKNLIESLNRLLNTQYVDDIHKEGIIDRLITNINKNHGFKEYKLREIATDIVDGANIYFRSHTGEDSVAMDNVLRNTALTILNSDADVTHKELAQTILDTLKYAHTADVDNDNLWRYIQLTPELDNTIKSVAGNGYRVIFDLESTGSDIVKSNEIYQLSATILDSTDTVYKKLNYIIKPNGDAPLHTVLKKSAPADAEDITKWWTDNIVNNPDAVTSDIALNNFYTTLKQLDTEVGVTLIGHNIKGFDIALLKEHSGNDEFIKWLEDVKQFDTYEYMVNNKFFELQGDDKEYLISRIIELLSAEKNAGNTVLNHPLFSWYDMYCLSEVRKTLNDLYLASPKGAALNVDDITHTYVSGFKEEISLLNDAIDDVNNQWNFSRTLRRLFRKATDSGYFTVTKAAITSDDVKKFLDELITKGIINLPTDTNISKFLNQYVSAANVYLSSRKAISYEMFDVFSLDKLKVKYNGTVVPKMVAENLTHQSRCIKNNMTWLTEDVVNELYDDAKAFLVELKETKPFMNNHIDLLYEAAEDNKKLIVASAVYYNQRLGDNALDRFKNIPQLKRQLKGDVIDYKHTPLLHTRNIDDEVVPLAFTTDSKTNRPIALYSDEAIYNCVEIVESQKTNPLDVINKFNVEHDIYNAHEAALHELYKRNSALAVDIENMLQSTASRTTAEQQIRSYRKILNDAAKANVLNRANRVEAFIAEAKLRAGRFVFTDSKVLDLSDFKEAGVLVDTVQYIDKHGNTKYRYWLGVTEDLYRKADDIAVNPQMLKPTGMPDDVYNMLVRIRQEMAAYVHNIGWSNGDVLEKELLEKFDSFIPESFKGKIVPIDVLQSDKYFNRLRANNSIIWDTDLQDLFDNHLVTDPFRQHFYNTEAFVKTKLGELSSYINLLYTEYNSINRSKLFDGLSNAELYRLAKQNPNMKWAVLMPSKSKWVRTKTGAGEFTYHLKEIKIINERSIELARKLDAHVIPDTHFLQMSSAINTFELPPIAQYARLISTAYKLGYLSSIGFIIRNAIDSNYKNRWALDGNVSIPNQVIHLFNTVKVIQRYNETGMAFSKYMQHNFKTDLEYDVFYNIIKNLDESDVVTTLHKLYPETYHKNVDKYINSILNNFSDKAVLRDLSDKLLEPQMFSIVHTFINHGPSAGLTYSILNNIADTSTHAGISQKIIKWLTEDSPIKFIYDWNEMVEQSARLSLFLQRLELGDTVDDATRAVIKTHFNYSDKSLAMLYTEIVFPFMSFSYKNLEYWVNAISEHPKLMRELQNILAPCLSYDSLFNPDHEAYKNFDYSFDWSKDVMSFEARAPWQIINTARLYHILSGNIIINTGKTVKHDNGYGEKDNELLAVFKLSPSILDATKMLYNPIDTYTQRMLPPAEILGNTLINVLNGDAPFEDISINTFINNLPFIGAPLQRAGMGNHNNITQRIKDAGLPMALTSLFTAAYVPEKQKHYWYDDEYNVLNPSPKRIYKTYTQYPRPYYTNGGFTPTYYMKRNFSNPYNTRVPTYTISKLARRNPNKPLYRSSVKTRLKNNYTALLHSPTQDNIIRKRVLDRFRYFN